MYACALSEAPAYLTANRSSGDFIEKGTRDMYGTVPRARTCLRLANACYSCAGGRRIRASSMPGRRMSAAYFAAPVTLSSAFSRCGDWPIAVNSAAPRTTALPSTNRATIRPFRPNLIERFISLVGAAFAAESRVHLVLSFQPIVEFAARSKATVRGN
jgi:hypothetical protein